MVTKTLPLFTIPPCTNMKYETLEDAQAAGAAPWDLKVDAMSDFHVTVFRDRYPVTPGHMLFVPNYNTPDVIQDALASAHMAGESQVAQGLCDGYNIGYNAGQAAGQTIMYPHIHLIPRRSGDCEDPVGGVRGVIPSQQNYKTGTYQQPV